MRPRHQSVVYSIPYQTYGSAKCENKGSIILPLAVQTPNVRKRDPAGDDTNDEGIQPISSDRIVRRFHVKHVRTHD